MQFTPHDKTRPEKEDSTNINNNVQIPVWPLGLYVMLLFWQIWFDIAGFTFRSEDVIAIIFFALLFFLPILLKGKLYYRRHLLNVPILLWCMVLFLGISVTLLSGFSSVTKTDALVNGIRLILATGMFFVVHNYPAPAHKKSKMVIFTILGFSLITTIVSLLQIGYWDGWLPIKLPNVLITFKEGANTARGREIFALYLGDTGSHTWSGALAMQALLVWLLGTYAKHPVRKWIAWVYFILISYILIRISVRNSILGLFVSIVGLLILRKEMRNFIIFFARATLILITLVLMFYGLVYLGPDTYFFERVRQVLPGFGNGKLIISGGSNIYGRIDYWVAAIQFFLDSPIVGQGFYSYGALSEKLFPNRVVHAHNSYFQTLAELGIIGIIALFLLFFIIGRFLIHTRNLMLIEKEKKILWEFSVGSLFFLAFSMIFSNTLWSPNYVSLRMILLGLIASSISPKDKNETL